jgi:ketosteroid isomerase-like protein
MKNDLQEFEEFLSQREKIGRNYVCGDASSLGRIVTHVSPASFFGPQGGSRQGADTVWSDYEEEATRFEPGGDNRFDILHMGASEGLAYWTGFQHAVVRLRGQPDAVSMDLRVTEVFRREGDQWRMIHRHADMLATEAG